MRKRIAMKTTKTRSAPAIHSAADSLSAVCGEIRDLVERKRLRIAAEISNYPMPIPACDAHFNHLLEERARVGEALNRLDALRGDDGAELAGRVAEFAALSPDLDDAAKRRIRSALKQALSRASTPAG